MSTLFDFLSLFYVVVGLRALWTLYQHRREFTDDDLTALDRRLASELAFFVFVPIGVLFHELGHAVATYQVGGTIDWLNGGFHYALFWGYVIPEGDFSRLQDWWIALSGNLVSVIYGFIPLALLPLAHKNWIKYLLLSLARIQLGWSLVGYPLLTLTGIDSDWSTIYSTWTLALSVPTFIVHAALVVALWTLDRSARVKRWELNLYAGMGDALRKHDEAVTAHFDHATKTVHLTDRAVSPEGLSALMARGNFFASHGEFALALNDYRAVLEVDPQNSRALYNIGQVHLQKKRLREAEKAFRSALPGAAGDPAIAGRLHYGLAMCLYQRGNAKAAIEEFDQAIARVPDVAEFYYWRGLARRQTRDDMAARNDFTRAAALAQSENPILAQQAQEMLKST